VWALRTVAPVRTRSASSWPSATRTKRCRVRTSSLKEWGEVLIVREPGMIHITIKNKMTKLRNVVLACLLATVAVFSTPAIAQRYVIADQDASGPAGSDMTSLLVLLQSPEVKLLGITVVTGDEWRDEEVAHTLRLLELIGRTDVKVYVGSEVPLVRTFEETKLASQLYGTVAWLGAWRWNQPTFHEASVIPKMPEGSPTTKAAPCIS
jgi:purine nucleosidase